MCVVNQSPAEMFRSTRTLSLFLFLKSKSAEIKVWGCGSLKSRFQRNSPKRQIILGTVQLQTRFFVYEFDPNSVDECLCKNVALR